MEKLVDDEFEDDFLEFGKIENPRHPRADICAFLMLHDLVGGDGDMVSAAEHDEIFLDVDLDDLAAKVTKDQLRDLVRCGVRIGEYDSLAMFV